MEELVEQAIIWWRPSSGRPVNGHLETLVVWNRCGATPFFERQKRELCVGCPVGHLNCTDRVGSSDHLNCFGEDALDQLMLVKTCWSFIDHQSLRSVKSAVVAAKTHTMAMTAQIAAGDTPSPAAPPRHISPSQMKGGGSTTKKGTKTLQNYLRRASVAYFVEWTNCYTNFRGDLDTIHIHFPFRCCNFLSIYFCENHRADDIFVSYKC
uniref:Uncharacterized protein n=1 Tax=Globodera rostochiensis TaxID=31243 RepID=A0A914HVW2_GLORO